MKGPDPAVYNYKNLFKFEKIEVLYSNVDFFIINAFKVTGNFADVATIHQLKIGSGFSEKNTRSG